MSDSIAEENKYRSYICPCGKTYLSYPALFTHVKQKHDGKPPGDIIRPRALNKRGRPRKNAPSQTQNQQYSQMPQYKSYASRQLLKSEEELQLQPAMSQLQSAKQRYQANLELLPSMLSPFRPASALNILQMEKYQQDNSLSGQNYQNIRFAIKDLFQETHQSSALSTHQQMQDLIDLNHPYKQIKHAERRSSRRPIGYDSWEMDFRTALLQFLDWAENLFTRWEFKNMELLIALTLYFFERQVEERTTTTTVNYVTNLNNLGRHFLGEIRKNASYKKVYILQKFNYFKLLVYIHDWLKNQNLTHYIVELNSKFQSGTHKNSQNGNCSSSFDFVS